MLASLIVEVVAGIPDDQRKKPVAILCTYTRVEIPAILEMVEGTLARISRYWYPRTPMLDSQAKLTCRPNMNASN